MFKDKLKVFLFVLLMLLSDEMAVTCTLMGSNLYSENTVSRKQLSINIIISAVIIQSLHPGTDLMGVVAL